MASARCSPHRLQRAHSSHRNRTVALRRIIAHVLLQRFWGGTWPAFLAKAAHDVLERMHARKGGQPGAGQESCCCHSHGRDATAQAVHDLASVDQLFLCVYFAACLVYMLHATLPNCAMPYKYSLLTQVWARRMRLPTYHRQPCNGGRLLFILAVYLRRSRTWCELSAKFGPKCFIHSVTLHRRPPCLPRLPSLQTSSPALQRQRRMLSHSPGFRACLTCAEVLPA